MNYTTSTDDEAIQLQLAHNREAWAVLYDIKQLLRGRMKYDAILDVDALYADVCEVLSKVET